MRKLLYFLLTFFGIILIYNHFDNHKINYISIGDGLIKGMNYANYSSYGYNDFIKEDLLKKNRLATFNNSFYNKSINGLEKDIRNNRTIWNDGKEYFIKKLLRESDFLVISVGMEELNKNYDKYNMERNYDYLEKMYLEIEILIKEVKKYAKGTIIFLGYYNPTNYYDAKSDEFFYNMDIRFNRLMMNNNILYVDLYEIVKGNKYKDSNGTPFLNIHGYKKIADIVSFYLE